MPGDEFSVNAAHPQSPWGPAAQRADIPRNGADAARSRPRPGCRAEQPQTLVCLLPGVTLRPVRCKLTSAPFPAPAPVPPSLRLLCPGPSPQAGPSPVTCHRARASLTSPSWASDGAIKQFPFCFASPGAAAAAVLRHPQVSDPAGGRGGLPYPVEALPRRVPSTHLPGHGRVSLTEHHANSS